MSEADRSGDQMPLDELAEKVIGAAYRVHNTLGFGFLESVYQKALAIELRKLGIPFQMKVPVPVHYEGESVGDFEADGLVDGRLMLELKSTQALVTANEVQLVNYLTATGIENGLLLNFGPQRVEIKRKFRTYRPRRE
jgi:GxxExxY protein